DFRSRVPIRISVLEEAFITPANNAATGGWYAFVNAVKFAALPSLTTMRLRDSSAAKWKVPRNELAAKSKRARTGNRRQGIRCKRPFRNGRQPNTPTESANERYG